MVRQSDARVVTVDDGAVRQGNVDSYDDVTGGVRKRVVWRK